MASLFLLFQYTSAARFKPSTIHFFPCYFVAVFAITIGFIVIFCAFITAGINMPMVVFFSGNIKRIAFSCSTNSTSFWRCIGSIFPTMLCSCTLSYITGCAAFGRCTICILPVMPVGFAFCCSARTGLWCSTSCGAEAVRVWRLSSGCSNRFSSGFSSGCSSRFSSRCGCSFGGRFNSGIGTCFGSCGSCSVIRRIGFSIGRRENCHKC